MNLLDIIAGPVMKIIDKVIPDPQAKAQATYQLMQLQQAGEFKEIDADLQRAQMQADINKEEAKSPSLLVSGWRPAAGWMCVIGLGSQLIVGPFFTWIATLAGHPVPFPQLDITQLGTLLFGMLGLGAYRMNEKIQGVATK